MAAELNGELRVVDDVPSAFAELVRERAGRASPFRIALSGGETARACYEVLMRTGGIDWAGVECYVGDERCVPPDDDDSNQKMIRSSLLDHVRPAAFHPMDCNRPEDYARLLAAAGPLDLVHLGLGPDGHTASLFPSSTGLEALAGQLVVRNLDPSGRNKHERLSLTFEAINAARLAVFTVSGEQKHEALARVLAGEDLPAARVASRQVVWLCDRAALGGGEP